MYKPVELPPFRGLELRNDAIEENGGALDATNVDITPDGGIRSRLGQELLCTAAGNVTNVISWPGQSSVVFTTSSNIYKATYSGTVSAGSASTATIYSGAGVEYGASVFSNKFLYLAMGGAGLKALSTSGSLSAAGGTAPSSAFSVALQKPDNRIVTADVGGKVQFSDPDTPATFGTNNYVLLPTGVAPQLVSWNNLLFAFTPNGTYVFYGNSVDGDGNPEFNWRQISAIGAGPAAASSDASWSSIYRYAVAGVDGVYFWNDTGVFKTTGGPPEKLSDAIDPVFNNTASAYFSLVNIFDPVNISLVARKLYLHSSSAYSLVYDLDTRQWVLYGHSSATRFTPILTFENSKWVERLVTSTGSTPILVEAYDAVDDNGDQITCVYQSRSFDLGAPGVTKVVRELLVEGHTVGGTGVAVSLDTAYGTGTSGFAIALGTTPTFAIGRYRKAFKGKVFSINLIGTKAFTISRIIANMRNVRAPGMK